MVSTCYLQTFFSRHVLKTEGLQALFKGLSLSLVGSVPTRAIYFSMYSKFKQNYNTYMRVNSNGVHFLSAMSAGVVTSTITCPIWVVKTQMQLDNRSVIHVLVNVYISVYNDSVCQLFTFNC